MAWFLAFYVRQRACRSPWDRPVQQHPRRRRFRLPRLRRWGSARREAGQAARS